jgi:hypothetical protein
MNKPPAHQWAQPPAHQDTNQPNAQTLIPSTLIPCRLSLLVNPQPPGQPTWRIPLANPQPRVAEPPSVEHLHCTSRSWLPAPSSLAPRRPADNSPPPRRRRSRAHDAPPYTAVPCQPGHHPARAPPDPSIVPPTSDQTPPPPVHGQPPANQKAKGWRPKVDMYLFSCWECCLLKGMYICLIFLKKN